MTLCDALQHQLFTEKRICIIFLEIVNDVIAINSEGKGYCNPKIENVYLLDLDGKRKIKIMNFEMSDKLDMTSLGIILYILLRSRLIVSNELNTDQLRAQIESGTLYMHIENSKKTSEPAKKLLHSLLNVQESINIEKIFESEWCTSYAQINANNCRILVDAATGARSVTHTENQRRKTI